MEPPTTQPDVATLLAATPCWPGALLVVGAPGTGKTYTINKIVASCAHAARGGVHVLAPTWSSASLVHGMTIYRWCKSSIEGISKARRAYKFDIVVVDEVFMISAVEMAAILRCCKPTTKLLLFGDPFQIKAIESAAPTSMAEQVVSNDRFLPVGGELSAAQLPIEPTLLTLDQLRPTAHAGASPSYWYDAFKLPPYTLSGIARHDLTTFHRSAGDPRLQNVLTSYRTEGVCDASQFATIEEADIGRAVVCQGYNVLVGTYKSLNHYKGLVNKFATSLKRDDGSPVVFFTKDGAQHREGEVVFTTSEYGSVQHKFIIMGYDWQTFGLKLRNCETFKMETITPTVWKAPVVDAGVVPACADARQPRRSKLVLKSEPCKDKFSYPLVSGDVLIINIAQGRTLSGVILDCDSFFQPGSFYTALSRVRQFEKVLVVQGCTTSIFKTDPDNIYAASVANAPSAGLK